MEYTQYVEICGNCHSLITWDAKGDPVCECMETVLQFIGEEEAKELGILLE